MSYTILLIEDNTEMAENIADILELAQYNVISATNGKEGVDAAQTDHPDLILCDIMMPNLDGYGVLHILRNDPDTATIPFIFLTAKADKGDFRAGMNLGADDYITKPFDEIDLLKVVEMRLKKSDSLKASFANAATEVSTFFNKTKEVKDFNRLSEHRTVRHFKKRDLIFMEGQNPNDLYYIEEGRIKTYKVNYDGKELITGMYGKGDFFGYIPLLEEKTYNENAESIDEVQVSVIPKSEFLSLIYSSKEVARKFIKLLSNNYKEIEDRLLEIAYQSVRQRVAKELLNLEERYGKSSANSLIDITRRDMSNIVGTATESLNRTLADFKEEGLIRISDHGLTIINKPKLEKLLHM
jgi:CRP-like cAMP-binding protein/DNA-binding NarL/FixJ family response regulator